MTRYETLQIILTAFILAAAIIAACIYGCQLSEMQKATEAATKAAEAAQDSVAHAKETAHIDQRAWVSVPEAVSKVPQDGQKFSVSFRIKNTGKTFAMKTKGRAVIVIQVDGAIPRLSDHDSAYRDIGVLAPSADFGSDYNTDDVLPDGLLQRLQDGTNKLFALGRVEYEDIFGSPHWVEYCWRLDPEKWIWYYCEKGNDTDNAQPPKAKTTR
jgi:archaellum component FlaG (FlaF/FlaG flagellin family)